METAEIRELLGVENPWWRDREARPRGTFPTTGRREAAFQRLFRAATTPGDLSVVMRGQRRIGKSVLLRQVAEELLQKGLIQPGRLMLADLSDPALRRLGHGPELLNSILDAMPAPTGQGPRLLLLDELQSVEQWAEWMKVAIDRHDIRVVATGSSSLELGRGGSESGRGRWTEFSLEGLVFQEWLRIGAKRDASIEDLLVQRPDALLEFLESGGSPEYLHRGAPKGLIPWRRELREDLERSVKADAAGLARDPNDTWRLYQEIADKSGNAPRPRKLAESLRLDPETVKSHLSLLERQMLVSRLGPSLLTPDGQSRSTRNRLSDDHVFVSEHGHTAALSGLTDPLANDTLRGRIHETAVFTALRVASQSLGLDAPAYLREKSGAEIDFVMRSGDRALGIEVSSTTRVDKKAETAGKAGARFGVEVVVVSSNPSEQWIGEVRCIPMRTFLLRTEELVTELLG